MKFLAHFLVAAGIFAVVDLFWLGVVANKLYKKFIGKLLLDKFRVVPAITFYLLFIIGLLIFALQPALASHHVSQAIWRGAGFGLFTYGTYDLTNLATLKDWSFALVAIDMAWGTFLAGAVTTFSYLIFAT